MPGPLHEMATTTATDYWNDSCSVAELTYAIERGAVGATTNPTIVGEVLRKEMDLWRDWLEREARVARTEDELAWNLIEAMAVTGAGMLEGIGRLSIQTDPRLYRDTAAIVEQALLFADLAPNIQVKIPATAAGIAAIEEVTAGRDDDDRPPRRLDDRSRRARSRVADARGRLLGGDRLLQARVPDLPRAWVPDAASRSGVP